MSKPSFITKQEAMLEEIASEGTPVEIEEEVIPETPASEGAFSQDSVSRAELDRLQSKYDVLQSKYDVEIRRALDNNADQADVIKQLKKDIEDLKNKGAEKAATLAINEDWFGEYEEPIQNLAKAHNAQVNLIESLKAELDGLKQSTGRVTKQVETVEGHIAHRETTSFWDKVREAVPEFDDINGDSSGYGADQRWAKQFLDSVEPSSKLKWREIVQGAINRGDYGHVIHVLNTFKRLVNYQPTKKNKLESHLLPNIGGSQKVTAPIKGISKEKFQWAAKERQMKRMSEEDFKKYEAAYYETLKLQAG